MAEITLTIHDLPGLSAAGDASAAAGQGGYAFTLSRPAQPGQSATLTIPIVNRGPESYAASVAQERWVSQRYPDLEMCFAGAWRTSDAERFDQVSQDLHHLSQGPDLAAQWLAAELCTRCSAPPPRAPNGCSLWNPRADVADSVRQAARAADLQDYDRVIALAPQWADGWLLRAARRHSEHEDFAGALADCQRAAAAQPQLAAAWVGQGWALVSLGRAAEAVEPFERALQGSPADPAIRVALAYALEKAGEFSKAAEQLRLAAPPAEAGSQRPAEAQIHLARARCLAAQQLWEEALAALSAASRCQPTQAGPWLERARLLRGLDGRLADALDAAKKACKLALEWEVEPHLLYGGLLRQQGKPAQALTVLATVASRAPDELRLCAERGLALVQLARWQEALPDLDRYLAAVSWWPAQLARAQCRWHALHDRPGALADLSAVLQVAPEDSQALALGQALAAAEQVGAE